MIVICDNCHARYLVPSHAIGAKGRRVRCTTCGHEWFQEEDDDDEGGEGPHDSTPDIVMEPIPESVRPTFETLTQPVPGHEAKGRFRRPSLAVDKKHMGSAAAGAGVILLLLAATIPLRNAVVDLWPPAAAFYNLVGAPVPVPGDGLTFDHITATVAHGEGGAATVKIDGVIINLRGSVTKVPAVTVTLKRADGKPAERWTVEKMPAFLDAQAQAALSTSHPLPDGADVKDVSVGFTRGR